MSAFKPAESLAFVLDLDPDLGEGISEDEWDSARQACGGSLIRVHDGWEPSDATGPHEPLALVIAHGLICREVAVADHHMLELLGPGEVLLRSSDEDPPLGTRLKLTAASDTLLIALGPQYLTAAARWHGLLANLHSRIERQRERLAIQGVIAHLPRAEHRLLLMLRHLADTWGHVTVDGIVVSLPLTHETLGRLTASRRSTATLAIRTLESDGLVQRLDDGTWLLTPDGERRVQMIALTGAYAPGVGRMLAARYRSTQLSRDSVALRAQARQIRRQDKAARSPGRALRGSTLR